MSKNTDGYPIDLLDYDSSDDEQERISSVILENSDSFLHLYDIGNKLLNNVSNDYRELKEVVSHLLFMNIESCIKE